ncbi:glycoside hydrolase family 5 protein [Methylobacterium oxalidis]|uniref:glycoside hydrolase family 5 protein n=1 Tax=Methylobacterium oxalidis TaxID=944322 RepID=UPI003314F5F7
MHGPKIRFALIILCSIAAAPTWAGNRQRAHEMSARLDCGINLGNALEAYHEGQWGLSLRSEHFDIIRKAGFRSVRVPIRWSSHAQPTPPYTIDPRFLARIDWVVAQALAHDLLVIIDTHNDDMIHKSPQMHTERFLAYWRQVASRYRSAPDTVLFEILNEPHGNLTSAAWNRLIDRTLKLIRETNPSRMVIVGSAEWNGFQQLDNLEIPETDDNLIVTFHYYSPGTFTHQGAPWVPGSSAWLGTSWGSADDHKAVESDFVQVKAWAVRHDRPVLLGEFGAYEKGDPRSRVAWTRAVSSAARRSGFSRMYWDFATNFSLYDVQQNRWRTDLLDAVRADASK